ncbi:YhcN/YlaJ family sporulation lipoprotein [Halalkalibacillus halophilus]|uniref:YhcN/YlaJ family sporulation lipoprotein n=1 Tax=Halalkalibacillus halophilus TaxID=392827 RepID=UPI000427CA2D|nr:YhcN/YlaJ family sporulation lipoprotein [Halalkalibacillus halophilus]
MIHSKYKWLFILILTIFLFACNQGQHSIETEENLLQVNDSEITQSNDHTNQEAAERLSEIANKVPNVNDATALVFGDYTIVGIDVDESLDRSRVGTIKFSVAEALKDDPVGHYAFVIADGDIRARIHEINNSIQNGRPQDQIIDEISNLVGRYIPETPPKS